MKIDMKGVLLLTEKYNQSSNELKLSLSPNEEQMILMVNKSASRLVIKGEFSAKRKKLDVLKVDLQKKGKVFELEEYEAVLKTFAETHDLLIYVENKSKDKKFSITFKFS